MADIVIAGAGHAGAGVAASLRRHGWSGSIRMVGQETVPPYERPPLSKDYLAGAIDVGAMRLGPPSWADIGVDLTLGREVVGVDPAAHRLTLDDGSQLSYHTLVWAAGAAPRTLQIPGGDLPGVHVLRTLADADAIKSDVAAGARTAVVIGGGYVGLEVAAALTGLGCAVTLLEAAERVLFRTCSAPLSAFYETEHITRGVDIRTGATVQSIAASGGRVAQVCLADGSVLPADLVVVGIGVAPVIGPLVAAGAVAENGLLVDAQCRTTLPNVYAIGDCAAQASPYAEGRVIRMESVQNAIDQGEIAAAVICGTDPPAAGVPRFWSDQYDLRLSSAGIAAGYDQVVVRGDTASRSFSMLYLRAGVVIAIDCVNAPRDFAAGRKLVQARAQPDPARVSDMSVALKSLV